MSNKPDMAKVRAAVGLPPVPNMALILKNSRQLETRRQTRADAVPDKVKEPKKRKQPVDASRRHEVGTTGRSCSGFFHPNFHE